MKKVVFIVFALLPALLCINRDGPVSPRDNPYDAGGKNWLINNPPSISGTVDARWYDYDHETGRGAVRITCSADDPDLPHDTLTYRIFAGIDSIDIHAFVLESDSTRFLTNLSPGTVCRCSLSVVDSRDGAADTVITFTSPTHLPPLPPQPAIRMKDSRVKISWTAVDGAAAYAIDTSGNRGGPFTHADTVAQPDAGPTSFADTIDEYTSRFYIIASVNSAGACRSRDTLYGRVSYSGIAAPLIDSISQGVFTDHVRLSWHVNGTTASRFEIYRAAVDGGPYGLLAVVNALPASNTYDDSGATVSPRYYKIAAVDDSGRAGLLSASGCGFLYSKPPPAAVIAEGYFDHAGLFWTPVEGAYGYVIYRSSKACSTGMARIATTAALEYRDSVVTNDRYFYAVAVVDSAGHEGALSGCTAGNKSEPPAPANVRIAGASSPGTITLLWDPLPGAREYIIYRSSTYCPKADGDIALTTDSFFRDTVATTDFYFYAVSAVDTAEREGAMSLCRRGRVTLPAAPENVEASFETDHETITLSWDSLPGIRCYIIYRSTTSCASDSLMMKIDSTASCTYLDSVPTSKICFYHIAGVDGAGNEGSLSACSQGRVKLLPAPLNIKASDRLYNAKIRVSWDAVAGADGYVIYGGESNTASMAVALDTVTSLFIFDSTSKTSLYYFWIAARNHLGTGTRSGYVSGRIFPKPDLLIVAHPDAVNLSWTVDATAALPYYIYRSSEAADSYLCIDSTMTTSYNDTPPDYDNYKYRVMVKTSIGDSSFSNYRIGCMVPPPPAGFFATDCPEGVLLQWNRIPGIDAYFIYCSESDSLPSAQSSITADTSSLFPLTIAARCHFWVAAYYAYGYIGPKSDYVIGGILQPSAAAPVRDAMMRKNDDP